MTKGDLTSANKECSRPLHSHPPSPLLAKKIKKIIRAEQHRERLSEALVRAYGRNGQVRIPRTEQYLSTEREMVWIAGTDDHLFKDFTEGALSALFSALTQRDAPLCIPSRSRHRNPDPRGYELATLGRQIVQCCNQYRQEWSVAYINHVFHPIVTVMLRAMKRYAVRIGLEVAGYRATEEAVRLLLQLVRFVRRVARTWAFINALDDHERQAQDNFDSAREFIYHLAGKCSKLLIMRIDLYYAPYYDAEKANKAILGFLRWLRSKACKRNLLPGYLGFIIKRENGLVRGMHWHVMVICSGNVQCNSRYLTWQIGERWAKCTGQGPGSYHNCDPDRGKYEHDGLGVLTLDDWEKMLGLRAALDYMTKQHCVLKVTNDKVKNFWRTPVRGGGGKKRGKRRRNDDGLQLLRRMLGGKRSKYPPGFDPGLRSISQRDQPA